jgi:hypothetical protein
MSDRVFFTSAALLAVFMVGLALVWPQGEGARSPGPFGRAEVTPAYVAAQKRKSEAKAREQREQLRLTPGAPVPKEAGR